MAVVILAKYGEIALRGKNRHAFEKQLMDALRKCLPSEGYKVTREQGRLRIERAGNLDLDPAFVLPRIENVLGLVGFCVCRMGEDQRIEALQAQAVDYMQGQMGDKAFTFKVKTRRSDKRYPLTSDEVSAQVGAAVLRAMPNARVDVKNPQVTLHVELRNQAYLYTDTVPGWGGLPAGASGKGMLLLSGGIDSPVAGFLMAKRGVALSGVHFHAPPFTSQGAWDKTRALAGKLATFTGVLPFYSVDIAPLQTYLYDHVPQEKLTIFLKRAMLAIAGELARKAGCHCLVTGDSVGQVASQTMQSLLAIDGASPLPVMRPLAGLDKEEIVQIAKKIGTFETSIQPYADCCTLFVAKHPDLRPKASAIVGLEKHLEELPALRQEAVDKSRVEWL